MAESKVYLDLSREEAIVFFEWLSRFNKAEHARFEDQAEQRVLWNLEAMLESMLVEPFEPNSDALLTHVRATVRDSEV